MVLGEAGEVLGAEGMADEENFGVYGVAYLAGFELFDDIMDAFAFEEGLDGLGGVRV